MNRIDAEEIYLGLRLFAGYFYEDWPDDYNSVAEAMDSMIAEMNEQKLNSIKRALDYCSKLNLDEQELQELMRWAKIKVNFAFEQMRVKDFIEMMNERIATKL